MSSSRCVRCAYLIVLFIIILFVGVFVTMSYFPRATNLLRSSLADVDVIIVGGGLAGLSAAIEASRHGARVTIVDKEKSLGGNSAKATSGINGAMSQPQADHEIEDSVELFIKDTLSSGGGLSNPTLVNILASQSAEAIQFLLSFGLNLTDVIQLGGHSVARTHRIPPTPDGRPIPVGFTIVSTLKKYIENDLSGIVNVITSAAFKSLILNHKGMRVVGIQYQTADGVINHLHGNVILTAGGYANDHGDDSLLVKHVPDLAALPTTNGPWATGDIIKATTSNNLALIHMDQVQTHPTGFIEPSNPRQHTKFLAPESLRGCGAILLNSDGQRFVNELGRRDHVTAAIFEKCRNYNDDKTMPVVAAMVMNQEVINRFGAPAAKFYQSKQIIEDVVNIDGLATRLKVDVETIKTTLKAYQTAADEGEDEFGKVNFLVPFSTNDHFYIAYITPTLHYCMGGIQINGNAEVLQATGGDEETVLPGLYGAGEVTGGVHGINRLGGNSLLECVVFGRIAGQNAGHFKTA